jgi:hypothetical protein
MKWTSRTIGVLQRTASTVAVVFGLATILAGGRVLAGADAGYAVYRPLLVFNTVMGAAYVAAGVAICHGFPWSRVATGVIAALNLAALGAILAMYSTGGAIAVDSLRAMALRAAVWLALFMAVVALRRASP